MRARLTSALLLGAAGVCAAGCGGVQSTLAPAGREAAWIADLFWVMTAGAFVVWAAVLALTVYCVRTSPEAGGVRRNRMLIIGGGVVVPTVVLAVLLAYGLAMLPPLLARAPVGSLRIDVQGEMWWWRVHYVGPDGGTIALANEVRLPVGEPVQFALESDNVIHSFWIPSLGGKMDMIPGRRTYLTLHPTEIGVFRGACAEYCGASHALMNFSVEVMEKAAFVEWLAHQARPALPPDGPQAQRGQEVFLATGCGACHRIAGTPAAGVIGPDLTHVGSRMSLAAGVLPNDVEAFARWTAHTVQIKPDAHMPPFDMLPDEELRALAVYLEGLK